MRDRATGPEPSCGSPRPEQRSRHRHRSGRGATQGDRLSRAPPLTAHPASRRGFSRRRHARPASLPDDAGDPSAWLGNRKVRKEDAEGRAPAGFAGMAEWDFDGDGETGVDAVTAGIDPRTWQLMSPLEKKNPKIREENPAGLFFVDKEGK